MSTHFDIKYISSCRVNAPLKIIFGCLKRQRREVLVIATSVPANTTIPVDWINSRRAGSLGYIHVPLLLIGLVRGGAAAPARTDRRPPAAVYFNDPAPVPEPL